MEVVALVVDSAETVGRAVEGGECVEGCESGKRNCCEYRTLGGKQR